MVFIVMFLAANGVTFTNIVNVCSLSFPLLVFGFPLFLEALSFFLSNVYPVVNRFGLDLCLLSRPLFLLITVACAFLVLCWHFSS
jgi:hypothetical protein